MTLVCAPVKRWPSSFPVDLYEVIEGSCKFLYNGKRELKFVDVDWEQSAAPQAAPLIVSYHNFQETPDLESILLQMKAKHPQARYYKLATYASSTLDALRMLHFQKKHPEVIGVCMGEKGVLTRILAPIVRCPIMYAPLTEEEKNAPGQLLWSELLHIYHFRHLSPSTQIYGLIGEPIRHSIGHLFHNDQFWQHRINAVYIKMSIAPIELPEFFRLIEDLPIRGLSVTAPLKESVFPFLSRISKEGKEIGAVNTLVRRASGWEASNTDSKAAADSLGHVKGQHVVILGAGGGAKAIAYELLKRQARVTLVNRTAEKGRKLAQKLHCHFAPDIPSTYDILVNATSSAEPAPDHRFLPGTTVMDIAIRTTPFLQRAQTAGCQTIDGFPMYFQQGLAQQLLFRLSRAL